MFAILFLMNYFIFSNFYHFFDLTKGVSYWTIIIILSGLYLFSSALEKSHFNSLTKGIYVISSTLLGLEFMAFSYLLIYKLLALFIQIPLKEAGITILFLTLITTTWGIINSHILKINKINLYYDKSILKKEIKIAHLSDIHIGTINTREYLQKVVDKTNSLNPDCVMLTGDLVDGSAPITQEMLKPLDDIKVPIYFIIGNHEIYDGLDFVLPILKKTKMKILRNETTTWNDIEISGIDFYEGSSRAKEEIKKLKISKDKFSILLNHPPTAFDVAVEKGFQLQLSGHTHYGQIFPFTLLVKIQFKRIAGIYKKANSYLFISTGTGTWGPPMRLLSRCEIGLINLKKK